MAYEPLENPFWGRGDLDEITPNTEAAVSIEEIKAFLKITNDDESAELLRAALQATRFVQGETGRAVTSVGLKLHIDAFPCVIELPYPPLLTPSTTNPLVKYVDTNGTEQTIASTLYQVHATKDQIRIVPAYGEVWPTPRLQLSAVRVTYTCGYAQASVPADVKFAVLCRLKLDRSDQLTGTELREAQGGYDRTINTLRRVA